jgi:glycogen operon protein
MITAGDEMGRTQRGNNNAYCQDNEMSWVDWELDDSRTQLLACTRNLMALRREFWVLRRGKFFNGQPVSTGAPKDVTWLRADGTEMNDNDFGERDHRLVVAMIHGGSCDSEVNFVEKTIEQTLLLVLNGADAPRRVRIPRIPKEGSWTWRVNTALAETAWEPIGSDTIELSAQSLALLSFEPRL